LNGIYLIEKKLSISPPRGFEEIFVGEKSKKIHGEAWPVSGIPQLFF
jgi:hypothetical protein